MGNKYNKNGTLKTPSIKEEYKKKELELKDVVIIKSNKNTK
jgi:hypothetical protein